MRNQCGPYRIQPGREATTAPNFKQITKPTSQEGDYPQAPPSNTKPQMKTAFEPIDLELQTFEVGGFWALETKANTITSFVCSLQTNVTKQPGFDQRC